MSLNQYIPKIKAIVTSLVVGISALMGIFKFEVLVPQPIDSFEVLGSIFLAVALIFSYVYLQWISKFLKPIIIVLCGILVLLFVFHIFFVAKVTYTDEYTIFVLHGLIKKLPDIQNYMSHVDVIKDIGAEKDDLRSAYKYFDIWLLVYQGLLSSLIFFFIMSISGISNKTMNK